MKEMMRKEGGIIIMNLLLLWIYGKIKSKISCGKAGREEGKHEKVKVS